MQSWLATTGFCKLATRVHAHRYFILRSFADYKSAADMLDVSAKCPCKIPLKPFSARHDGMLGTFMKESVSTGHADHNVWSSKVRTEYSLPNEAEGSAEETRFASSMKPLLKTREFRTLRWMARRRGVLYLWISWIATLTLMNLDDRELQKTLLPAPGQRCLLIELRCKSRTEQDNVFFFWKRFPRG